MEWGGNFGALDSAWRTLQSNLKAEARVLIVDGDQSSRSLLEQLLSGEGYQVDTCTSSAEAWALIESRPYDLMVVDKALRDGSGLGLIVNARETGREFPCVLTSAFPSVAGIAEAIGAGASDFISKPFPDLSRLVSRLQSLLEQRLAERLYKRISDDLTEAIKAKGDHGADLARVGAALFEFKKSLGERPSVLLIEASAGLAEVAQDALAVASISSEAVTCLDTARERLEDPMGPLTAVVSLGINDAVDFISERRGADPLIEIVATAPRPTVELALAAVEAGAADVFSRSSESLDALQARVRRAVARSRRQRLYVHLVSTLYKEASCLGVDSEGILALVPPSHRRIITAVPVDCSSRGAPCPKRDQAEEKISARNGSAEPTPEAAEPTSDAEPPPVFEATPQTPAAKEPPSGAAPAPPPRSDQSQQAQQSNGSEIGTSLPLPEPPWVARFDPAPATVSKAVEEPEADPQEPQGADRRAFPRYPCAITAQLRPWGTSSTLLPCRLRDISMGGMFIHMPTPPPIGTRFEIRIEPPPELDDGEPVELVAEVVRLIRVEPDPNDQTGVGVRLLAQPKGLVNLTAHVGSCGDRSAG